MNARLYVLSLLSVFITLASCAPGEYGWCRTAKDYMPAASGEPSNPAALGEITVAPAQIEGILPEGFDKTAAEKLITDLLVKDLSYCGSFSNVDYAEGNNSVVTVYPSLERISLRQDDGVYKLKEISVKVRLYRAGRLLLEKTYSRTWTGAGAPDYERAWREILPPALLEIRQDIVGALS